DEAKFIAYSYHGHASVELKEYGIASTSYDRAIDTPAGRSRPQVDLLTLYNNRSYVGFGFASSRDSPEPWRKAIEDHQQVRVGMTALPLPADELRRAHGTLSIHRDEGKELLERGARDRERETVDARIQSLEQRAVLLHRENSALRETAQQQQEQIKALSKAHD